MTKAQTTEVKEVVVSKAQKALAIYNEEFAKDPVDKLRARVIKRFKEELDMKDAGASTYFQNTKKIASGGKVKHYYKPKSKESTDQSTDDSKEDQQLFNVKKVDGTVESFMKKEDADRFIEDNGGELISEEEAAQTE